MNQQHTTLAQFKSELASVLGDPEKVFWTDSELTLYARETLRTFNAAARLNRCRALFPTTANQPFYDVPSVLSDGTTLVLERTLQDTDVLDEMAYSLMETILTGYSELSDVGMFTLDQWVKALQRRRDQFLLETGIIITDSTTSLIGPATRRVQLSDSIIDVRRVAWKTIEGVYTHLWREDERRLTAYSDRLETGTPEVYAQVVNPLAQLTLQPAPQDDGYLRLLTVNSGAALDPSSGVLLGVPDDFAWVIKYGAMADLLSGDGVGKDEFRAGYCRQRWDEGVLLARFASSVLDVEIDGSPAQIMSLAQLDSGEPGWENDTGTPLYVAMAGHNLIALSPVPDGVHSLTCDVVRNAIVPTSDSDYLQVGREHLSTLLRFAAHLAMFKCGGREFADSADAYTQLMQLAETHNERLRAESSEFESLHDASKREAEDRPRKRKAA
jgi:hypothetical protein